MIRRSFAFAAAAFLAACITSPSPEACAHVRHFATTCKLRDGIESSKVDGQLVGELHDIVARRPAGATGKWYCAYDSSERAHYTVLPPQLKRCVDGRL